MSQELNQELNQALNRAQSVWIKDPIAILAVGAERGVVVREGRIVELVPAGVTPAIDNPAVFEASQHVILPGLINTHHHFYQTLTRAVPAAMDRELFPWLQALYPVWARLTPEALDLGVTVAMAELLLSGCTTTTDHHYVFPSGLEDAVDIEVAVAKRLGMRVLLTRGSMNRSQRDGGLPPDSVVQDEDTILADSARVVAKHHERGIDAMVQIALAPCSPFSVTSSLMRATAELADLLAIDHSSAFRLANTLKRRGFLACPGGRTDYVLGPAIWRLSRQYDWSNMLVRVCHEHLKRLAGEAGETAHLAVREGRQALFVDHATSNQVILVSGPVSYTHLTLPTKRIV